MLGVPVTTASVLFGDNQSSQISCSIPTSQLKKKHNAISYHKIRESTAAGIVLLAWIRTFYNLADVLTKALGGKSFCSLIWFYLFGKGPKFVKGSIKNRINSNENRMNAMNDSVSETVPAT